MMEIAVMRTVMTHGPGDPNAKGPGAEGVGN